ncbi:MAG: redoxin domain-containing protein [Chitinophagaceae bacterium]
MKKSIFLTGLFLLATVALVSFKIAGTALPIGSEMPLSDTKVKDITGKEIKLKDAKRENGLLVMFSCNTCPYVVENQERTKAICEYALANNIGVILLNPNELLRESEDSFEEMKIYGKSQGYKWFYAVDKDNLIADAFGAKRTPECFLFTKDLKLAYHGGIDDNPGDAAAVNRIHLKEAITELVAAKEVSIKESRSVGCAIKRKSK